MPRLLVFLAAIGVAAQIASAQIAPGGPANRPVLAPPAEGPLPVSAATPAPFTPPAGTPAGVAAPTGTTTGTIPGPAGTAPRPGPDMVRLQFPNSEVGDVLRFYESLTGARLVVDNFVQGKVNIFLSKEVTREDAIRIIEMNLLLNGYSLVPAGDGIVKVIGTGRNPRAAGVPIISEEEDIPPGDHVISFLFKLHYADPQELQQVLGQYLSPPQPYTSFLALMKSSSILVTENSAVIRGLVRVINQIDVPPAEVVSEFIKLERADAAKVVEMLNAVFEKGAQPGQNAPGGKRRFRPVVPAPPQPQQAANNPPETEPGAFATLSEDSVVVGKIKLNADIRTNRIHVITRPINMPFVRKLISEFDANVEFAKPVTRPLKYIAAADVLPVLVQALTEPGANAQQGGDLAPNGQRPPQNQRNPNATVPGSTTSNSTASDSALNVSEELSTQATDTTPKAVVVGNTKLIADARANSIIILGNREVVVKVSKILDEMDVRSPQVALSTVIGELTLNNNEEFGVDYFLQFKRKNLGSSSTPVGVGGGLNNALANASIIDPASLITYPVLSTLPTGATAYVAAGNTLSAIVKALDSTGRFKTISRPTVFTSNNKKAIIASGQEIPVPVSTISSASGSGIINTGLAQQSNIQFKKVALQLEVVPLINSEKEVSLDILQKLDSVAGFTPVDNNQIPTIATRYIKTSVSAPNGSTIVLGGLITQDKRRNASGFPVLDRIPLLGSLFRDTTTSKNRTELIVLMRPEVTMTKLELARLRDRTKSKTHFGSDLEDEEIVAPVADKQLPPPDLPMAK